MQAAEIAVGMKVRYSRTGTTGTVVRIEEEQGSLFAEIDTTHLFYRVDQLSRAGAVEKKQEKKHEDLIEQLEKEREYVSGAGFAEAISHSDQSCEGGG
jgi:hypothetical protein